MTVSVSGVDGLEPITSFSDLPIDRSSEKLCSLFSAFKTPSAIQQYAWPALFAKKDVVGISETGSGKTLAFSLPILSRILKKYGCGGGVVRWVTIAPTRELALQTYTLIEPVIPSVCLYGGVSRKDQIRELRAKKPLAVVATPGRLQDLLESNEVDLSKVRFLVLDEADRMLDAGFEPAVSAIVAKMTDTKNRQTVLFSATWPSSVQKMAAKYTKEPVVKICCVSGSPESTEQSMFEPKANINITQTVHVIDQTQKSDYLLRELKALKQPHQDRVIVFVLYKKEAPQVEYLLKKQGYKVRGLHGDMTQSDRTEALNQFKAGGCNILIATDVAARGLDIPSVMLVFNYTFPLTVEDYVHRIGRTGRGGATGRAVTLFTEREKALAGALQNVLKQTGHVVPKELLAFGCTTKKRLHKEYGAFYKDDADAPMPAATRIKFDSDNE